MKFIKNKAALLFVAGLLLFSNLLFSQNDSCNLRISLLTCTPGEDLYSTFGHSAIRVTDLVTHSDIVYNYGTFNFEEPGFYTKFIRGKLTFYVSTEEFDSFLYSYQYENRGITEQVLNLSCAEKYNLLLLLKTNLLPQNRYYKYDFTFDNCTTRLRDLVEKGTAYQVRFPEILHKKATFRDLIYEYLDYNDKQWSKLGIDLLLGSRLDRTMKPREEMFLPDYLMQSFDSADVAGKKLVLAKQKLIDIDNGAQKRNAFADPIFIFTCLLLLIIFLSFSKSNFVKRILDAIDGFLLFLTGLLGILFIFMWIGTDHLMTKDNYNLLWAWPTNVVAAFYIHSKKKAVVIYFFLYALLNLLLLICWFLLPQHLNPALMPVIGIIIFRILYYVFRQYKKWT
ncbi:MAG: DUF4105 domain-containing protein [Ginsengibacter sp.]